VQQAFGSLQVRRVHADRGWAIEEERFAIEAVIAAVPLLLNDEKPAPIVTRVIRR
jgi:hypothetical protein